MQRRFGFAMWRAIAQVEKLHLGVASVLFGEGCDRRLHRAMPRIARYGVEEGYEKRRGGIHMEGFLPR